MLTTTIVMFFMFIFFWGPIIYLFILAVRSLRKYLNPVKFARRRPRSKSPWEKR